MIHLHIQKLNIECYRLYEAITANVKMQMKKIVDFNKRQSVDLPGNCWLWFLFLDGQVISLNPQSFIWFWRNKSILVTDIYLTVAAATFKLIPLCFKACCYQIQFIAQHFTSYHVTCFAFQAYCTVKWTRIQLNAGGAFILKGENLKFWSTNLMIVFRTYTIACRTWYFWVK